MLQVAASISSGHELVITELIFNGAFTDLGTEQLLAACSCFVCQEKMPAEQKVRGKDAGAKTKFDYQATVTLNICPQISEALKGVLATVQEAARRVAKTSIECRIEVRLTVVNFVYLSSY